MSARSWLFVPGDSDRKLAKSEGVDAELLILDLEDAVAPEEKPAARHRVAEFLRSRGERARRPVWVRINPLDTHDALRDLAVIMPAAPDGIVQPKTRSPADVDRLGHYLDALEAAHGLEAGATRILPLATETAEALFSLGEFRPGRCARLEGLTWGAEDLSVVLGASANRDAGGAWTRPFEIARSLCLFAARAAGVSPIDTVFADVRNQAGLRAQCLEARRDGFVGKLAIHPEQVPVINECFVPSAAEIERARAIIAHFAAHPGVAALAFEGGMVDIPHLRQAERLLARIGGHSSN